MKNTRVIVGKEVASFRYNGKRYKPGDVVGLPDNFPVQKYPWLKTHLTVPRGAPRAAKATAKATPQASTIKTAKGGKPRSLPSPDSTVQREHH